MKTRTTLATAGLAIILQIPQIAHAATIGIAIPATPSTGIAPSCDGAIAGASMEMIADAYSPAANTGYIAPLDGAIAGTSSETIDNALIIEAGTQFAALIERIAGYWILDEGYLSITGAGYTAPLNGAIAGALIA